MTDCLDVPPSLLFVLLQIEKNSRAFFTGSLQGQTLLTKTNPVNTGNSGFPRLCRQICSNSQSSITAGCLEMWQLALPHPFSSLLCPHPPSCHRWQGWQNPFPVPKEVSQKASLIICVQHAAHCTPHETSIATNMRTPGKPTALPPDPTGPRSPLCTSRNPGN